MPLYEYIVSDEDGKRTNGSITADSETDVVARIRKDNVIIISIAEVISSSASAAGKKPPADIPAPTAKKKMGAKKIKTKDIVVFSRQFSTMIGANVTIIPALEALAEQTANPSLKQILEDICVNVKEGNSLSSSFAGYPKVFDSLYVNMLRVGEMGGILHKVLDRTALYLEQSEKFRQKIKAAMVYPAVIMSTALMITTGLIIFVVPTFAHIYDSLGQKLPAMTQALIDLSNFLRKFFWAVAIFITGSVILFKRYCKTPQGRLRVDQLLLNLPIFGEMVCKVAVSRFCHTFATLMQCGVPIMDSLEVVKQSSGNRVIELLTEDLKSSVREGEGISSTLVKTSVFPVMVTRMISIGEKSGQLDTMLIKVAEFYDEEMEALMEAFSKIIEPVVIGFLGTVIGFIVIALFMPILNMATAMH